MCIIGAIVFNIDFSSHIKSSATRRTPGSKKGLLNDFFRIPHIGYSHRLRKSQRL